MIRSYVAVRRLRIGDGWREGGEPVPEAVTWNLVESLVRAGEIREVDINAQEFSVAVQEFCPDEADAIYTALGVEPYDPGPVIGEPKSGNKTSAAPRPRRGRPNKAPILVEPPEPLEA